LKKPKRTIPTSSRGFLQIYEYRKKEKQNADKGQAEAARHLAAFAVVTNVKRGLELYREATALDPDNMAGWLGLGDAAVDAGILGEADQAFLRYVALASRARDERETAVGLTRHGDGLVAHGNLPEALKSFRDGLAIRERLAQSDPGNIIAIAAGLFLPDQTKDCLGARHRITAAATQARNAQVMKTVNAVKLLGLLGSEAG
jgi:tetratricopeptide (TPR) repeat protein